MSCHEFERLVALYVEGDLESAEHWHVEAHLLACPVWFYGPRCDPTANPYALEFLITLLLFIYGFVRWRRTRPRRPAQGEGARLGFEHTLPLVRMGCGVSRHGRAREVRQQVDSTP